MKWVVDVALNHRTGEPTVKLPRIYRRTTRIEGRHAVRYAVWGLHLAILVWHYWQYDRWMIEDLFFRLGFMEGDHDDAPTYRSLRWGSPLRILKAREQRIREAARAGRDYAIARAREEGAALGARLTAEQLEDLRRMVRTEDQARQAYEAHAASFGALQTISSFTDLEGEVSEYSEVVKAVERLYDRKKELEDLQQLEQRR